MCFDFLITARARACYILPADVAVFIFQFHIVVVVVVQVGPGQQIIVKWAAAHVGWYYIVVLNGKVRFTSCHSRWH